MEKVLIELHDYPILVNEWLRSRSSLEQIMHAAGAPSATKVGVLTYAIEEDEFAWFRLRWM